MKKILPIIGVILVLAAIAALAVRYWPARQMPGAAQSAPAEGGIAIPDDKQLAQFEAMAVSACQCAKSKDKAGIGACWIEFDKATRPFEPNTSVSLCMDTNESLCFGMGDGIVTPEVAKRIKCISVNRSGSGICTEADAREAAAKAAGMDC